jgi:tetratricopeptide (TPR) repeat protein
MIGEHRITQSGRTVVCRLLLLLLTLNLANWVYADTVQLTQQQQRDVLIEAQHAYQHGIDVMRKNPGDAKSSFEKSAERYELVIANGAHNGPVYYNLANAYLQSGRIGKAIVNYRRALKFIPNDGRMQSNLTYARSLCRSQIPLSGERALTRSLLWWHDHTPVRSRFNIFLVVYVILWLALLVRLFRPAGLWTSLAILGLLGSIALGLSVGSDLLGWGRHTAGVLLADNIAVRKGNGNGFELQLAQPLHQGVEFDVLEQRGEWINVQFPNGSSGWIESKDAELVP